jgi:hypothetical protein
VKRTALILSLLLVPVAARAQAPCGLSSMTETVAPVYPPTAKSAHIAGDVILIATFRLDGSVSETHVLSGPMLLQQSAIDSVSNWRANAYGGPRTCPVVIRFVLNEQGYAVWPSDDLKDSERDRLMKDRTERMDAQHFVVYGQLVTLYAVDISPDHTRSPRPPFRVFFRHPVHWLKNR